MQTCENSNIVTEGAKTHAVNLTGEFYPNIPVLARAGFGFMPEGKGVMVKIAVRSTNSQINNVLANAIR